MKNRLAWLSQRQGVVATNIANADTPGYQPKDLKPFSFGDYLAVRAVALTRTNGRHLSGTTAAATEAVRTEDQQDVAEVQPNGNAVLLEEQMAKVQDITAAHRLTTQLYKKYMDMLRLAAGSHG